MVSSRCLAGSKHHHRHFRILGDQHARFHPIIDVLCRPIERNGRPGCGFGDRSKLLVLVERQPVDMDFGQTPHTSSRVIRHCMRGLRHRPPRTTMAGQETDDSKSNPKSRTSARDSPAQLSRRSVHVAIFISLEEPLRTEERTTVASPHGPSRARYCLRPYYRSTVWSSKLMTSNPPASFADPKADVNDVGN